MLASTPLGPVYGAALGSGIGTLMQGGNAEDALKNAVIAGGAGALFSGGRSVAQGGTFMGGVGEAFSDPAGRFGQTLSGDGGFFGDYKPVTAPQAPSSAPNVEYEGGLTAMDTASPQTGSGVTALESIKQTIMPDKVTLTDALEQMGVDPAKATAENIKVAESIVAQGPGFIRRFGPSLALAGLAAGSAGFFDAPEVEEVEYDTGADLLAQNREKYGSPAEQLRYITDYNPFVPPPARRVPVMQAAEGGVVGGLRGLAEYSEDVVGNLNQMMYGGQGPSSTATAAPTLPPIAPPAATAPSGPLFGGGGTAVSSMPAPITATPTPPNPSGPSFGTKPNEFNPAFDQMLRTPQPSVAINPLGDDRKLSLNDMSLLGMATPSYMPLDRGDGMDQFGRPIQSQLTDAERAQAEQGRALMQERRNQPSSPLFSNLGLSGLGSLGPLLSGYAEGGEIFPRRTGGIMPDEGVPNEDSVRAMLMPGEFVMTTDAVKGLGNGDNEQGIRKMYDMMRGLEAKGRAMA